MESISALQEARDALKQNINDVNDNIKKLTGRDPEESRRLSVNRRMPLKRNSFGRAGSNQQPPEKRSLTERRRWGATAIGNNNLDSGGEEEDQKKPAVHSSVVATGAPIEPLRRPKADDTQTKKRNQRMFGMLLGTLNKFKQENQFKTEQDVKREEKLHKVEEHMEKDKEEAVQQRKELYQTRRDKQKELRKLEFKIEMAELATELKIHYEHMKDNIQLKSTPRLFYRPALHNDKTKKLLKESKESLKDSLEQRVKEVEMCTEEDLLQPSLTFPNRHGGGKTAKNPIVIDAAPSTRDLFAEDADNDKLEREADEKKSQQSEQPIITSEEERMEEVVAIVENSSTDIVEEVKLFEEVKSVEDDKVVEEDMIIPSDEATQRVVVNGSEISDDRKVELSSIEVGVGDSRRVVSGSSGYSVVDERVVELNNADKSLQGEGDNVEMT